jgi:hypothetical protein
VVAYFFDGGDIQLITIVNLANQEEAINLAIQNSHSSWKNIRQLGHDAVRLIHLQMEL